MGIETLSLFCLMGALTTPEIHGHRGARASRPENTLPAFQFALENGADVLEMDLVVTKDDHIVVHHDLAINTKFCAKKDGSKVEPKTWIRGLSLERVQSFDCGSLNNPQFPKQVMVPGTKIPSLREVFEFLSKSTDPRAATVKLNLETKMLPAYPEHSVEPTEFANLLVSLLKEYALAGRSIVQSFDHRVLQAVKAIDPKIQTAALVADNLPVDLVRMVRLAGADIISPPAAWITRDQIKTLRAVGIRVIPWTVNEEDEWKRMLELEVDGIITDDPQGLRAFLTRRSAAAN